MQEILWACSIIACVIGVATFVVGMKQRSTSDGVLLQKVNQALEGIEELKTDSKANMRTQHAIELKLSTHEEQIHTLFNQLQSVDKTSQALLAILEILKSNKE